MGELQGRIFGGYQLLDVIGGGGVAEVYRARQVSGGGREVVVKVIFKEFARQPGFAHNFAYVTEASARLASHPHILPLVAHGEESEYLYLVTPYVKEGTLADWIKQGGRLGAADAGPFFHQLCGALSYAHSLGVVHGNLKPSNIFLHEGRHILLGDFGLLWDVRALDPSWSGSGVEAFEYLAPEVFGGQITQAGDLYSLGATLFNSLTGHTPFHKDKLADLIAAAQQLPPPSLGQQQPPLAPALAALDPVVAQAMAKRPEMRYGSAVLLAQAIEGALRQAIAQGLQSAPLAAGLPQWQPFVSTPVSAGVFTVSGPHTPGQADALGGLGGILPLNHMDAPFPPLPPTARVDEAMEAGGTALGGGLASNPGASHTLEPPTMRVPAPPEPSAMRIPAPQEPPTMHIAAPPQPTMRIPAPQDAAWGDDMDDGWGSDMLDQAGQPITAPRLPAVNGFAASGMAPLVPPDALRDPNLRRISERLPAVRRDDMPDDTGEQVRSFSPTALDLPRLTNPALGNLPHDWQELLTDESATRRHDPFASSSGDLPPITSAVTPAAGRPDRFDESEAGWRDGGWDASDASREWEAANASREWETPRSPTFDASEPAMAIATPRRSPRAIESREERPRSRSRNVEDAFNDTLNEQKVWTSNHALIRFGKRVSVAPLILLLLAGALLLELAGFAVARPDLCVTNVCAVVAGKIQQYVPDLQIPGAPAPVTMAPSALKISAATNGSGAVTVTLTNTGSRNITWNASTTLGWLTVSPASGSLAKGAHTTLTLTSKPGGVTPGSYSAGLVVNAATGQSTMPVALTVTQGPVLAVETSKLAFSSCDAAQPLTITNRGGAKLTYTASPSQATALSISPSEGALGPGDQATLNVTLSCSATTGQPYAVILVSDGGSAQTPVSYGS